MEKLDVNIEEPQEVLKFFKEVSDIPRESGNEEGICKYLIEFAKNRNLEYYTDEYFNVIIRKNLGNKEWIAFQAHTDMICEKEKWSNHNFLKDPIKLLKDGDFIKADGTTLGCDNGMGVAYMLALLDLEDKEMPNLECIFTVQEETTMIGAKFIDINQIKSKKIISLDNGKEGKMTISSANCMEWFGKINLEMSDLTDNFECYELVYSNFKGGHSGGNIADEKRGNPIKLGIGILAQIDEVFVSEIKGGSKVNVIPRDFKVQFSCREKFENFIKEEVEKQKVFYGDEVDIQFKKIEKQGKVFSQKTSKEIIGFINSYENGALRFDKDNNVILSANFAGVRVVENYIRVEYSLRSNDLELRDNYLKDLKIKQEENNVEIIWEQELPGFEPDYQSGLVRNVSEIYESLFNKQIDKIIVQGVLEGGFFKSRIKDLEYICIGPDSFDAHSPKERVSISSIKRTWNLLKEIIKRY